MLGRTAKWRTREGDPHCRPPADGAAIADSATAWRSSNDRDKALEKPPEQRYADVNQLAADLERFLRHEPLLARQHGPAYRTRKLLVRHRLRVAAAAIGLVAVSVGFGASRLLFTPNASKWRLGAGGITPEADIHFRHAAGVRGAPFSVPASCNRGKVAMSLAR
jgi:hypothetical protein